tara:strand:- start:6 stop:248 length:243 start_codon:yes stop_codon:yes gene_type:complete
MNNQIEQQNLNNKHNNKFNIKFQEVKYKHEHFYDFTNIFYKIYSNQQLEEHDLNKIFFSFLFIFITILFVYEIYNFIYLE